MKKNLCCSALFLLLYIVVPAQQVIIKGTLRCMNNNVRSTKGAENIVIIPSFNPQAAVVTTTTPLGFFQVNTGWPINKLKDKEVTLYIVTKCEGCKKIQRVFISQDLDKRNMDTSKMYVTVKNWKLTENCKQVELADMVSEKILDSARRLPALSIDRMAPGSPAMLAGSFANLFEKLVTTAVISNAGVFQAENVLTGKIKFGSFLRSSATTLTNNTGFNFSPSRNLSEAVFWNASAIVNSRESNNISLLTNFKNNGKLSGYQQLSKKVFLGAGIIYTQQDEYRKVSYENLTSDTPYFREKLREYAVFLAPVFRINNKMSAGITIKSVWQKFNIPDVFAIQTSNGKAYNFFQDDSVSKQNFDADISFSYNINNFLQAGVTVMNVTGSKLYSDIFIPGETNKPMINQRTYGVGVCYKRGRLNVGADAVFTEKNLFDATIGVNYVPFNNALIAGGFAFKQKSFSVSFKLKHFRIAYINDNDLMINEKKTPKAKLFDGKIYSGFSFDF